MSSQRTSSRPTYPAPASQRLYVASMLSIFISTSESLSLDPTNRYKEVMGKLMRDQQQLRVVASPTKAEEDVDTQSEDEWSQHQQSSTFCAPDEVATNMVDGPGSAEAAQEIFDAPHPPSIPYYQRQRELFGGYYPESTEEDSQQQIDETQRQTNSRGELFEKLNWHIDNLDRRFQAPDSLRGAVGENAPQSEAEWKYDIQNGYFQAEEGDSSLEYHRVEANGSTYYCEATDQNGSEKQSPTAELQSEQENQTLRRELEQLAAIKKAAEESAKPTEQELQERERLERERLEQQYRAETVERLNKEKEALKLELARRVAAEERRVLESKLRDPVSIAKSEILPKLPDTNDPFELLGLNYWNPPETAEDLRRAFLKMAKKHHPDAVTKDATTEEREKASLSFARINSAYQLLKDKQERLGGEYFATMLGGPMYDRRNSHVRQSYSQVDQYGSIFSGNGYSATYGARRNNGKHGSHNWDPRNPFRRNRREVRDNCHVSTQGEDFPPFFNN